MFKRLTVILLVIFMITIEFQPSLTKASGATNDESFNPANSGTTLTTTAQLNIPSLSQWVLDEPTNTLYAISQANSTLYFINATTMAIEKSITLTGGPTDIIKDSGKLYISIDGKKQIVIVDMASRAITQSLITTTDPYRIVIDGNKLYYIQFDQFCDIYAYDLTTNNEQKLAIIFGKNYEPDIAINTDKHILYIGESGSSGSDMTYYSTTNNTVIGKTNYDNGYGFPYPQRYTLCDGVNVYYAGRDFTLDNPKSCIGDFGGSNVIFAKNNFVFTNTSIYDATTHVKLGDYGSSMNLIEASNTTIYLYSSATGIIKSFKNSNIPIDKNNIISLISGTATIPIQSNTNSMLVDTQVHGLEMDSTLTQWVLDESTNTLYGISNVDKALFFVNATTLNLEKSITFTSGPTDIIIDNGKLYISLDDISQIAIVDMHSRVATGTLYTSSDPFRIVIDGNKLYYTERDQSCKIHAYDVTTNTDQAIAVEMTSEPDLAINTDKHILYIGESGSSGSNMIYYSTTNNTVIGKTNYNGGRGFLFPQRCTLFDGEVVYYAGRDFDPEDPTIIYGNYSDNIIFAKYGCAFSNTSLYDSYYNQLLVDGMNTNLAEISNKGDLYLYNVQNKAILKIEPTIPQPVINSVSPNTGLVKGGTVVNITGTGFTGATKVDFGDTPGPT